MSKICPNSIQNMFQNFPKYVQNLCEICPNISKICPTFVHNMFPTDWEVATTSVTYQSVSSSRTDESVVSMARHCRGQQPRNPALPQPSSGCRAKSM